MNRMSGPMRRKGFTSIRQLTWFNQGLEVVEEGG